MDLPQERIAKLEAQVEGIKDDVAAVKQDIKELHSRVTTTTREITDHIDHKIDELAKSDAEQHTAMSKKIDQIKDRVDILEKWRFMIVGGALALGYLISHVNIIDKFFK
jgi:putative NADH-flavin reductase